MVPLQQDHREVVQATIGRVGCREHRHVDFINIGGAVAGEHVVEVVVPEDLERRGAGRAGDAVARVAIETHQLGPYGTFRGGVEDVEVVGDDVGRRDQRLLHPLEASRDDLKGVLGALGQEAAEHVAARHRCRGVAQILDDPRRLLIDAKRIGHLAEGLFSGEVKLFGKEHTQRGGDHRLVAGALIRQGCAELREREVALRPDSRRLKDRTTDREVGSGAVEGLRHGGHQPCFFALEGPSGAGRADVAHGAEDAVNDLIRASEQERHRGPSMGTGVSGGLRSNCCPLSTVMHRGNATPW